MDDNTYAKDYFCYQRDLKYLNVLVATQEDLLGLMYFYGKTFRPDQVFSKEE
jgi:hypothetical protein